jgi:hypothetical protein
MKYAFRIALLFLLIFALASSWSLSQAQVSNSSTESNLISAFQAISSAESKGGNVTSLANMLNQAAYLNDNATVIAQSNQTKAQLLYSQANALISQVESQAPALGQAGATQRTNGEIEYIAEMSTLVALAILAYLFVPRLFWKQWLKNRRKWTAKKGITDVQLLSILLVIILILGLGFTYDYFDLNAVTSPFSEMAILGPGQTLSGYPKNVSAGQSFTLYLHVGDYEGHVMYYKVLEKLTNVSSVVNQTTYLNVSPIATYSFILAHNATALREITPSLNKTGVDLKLVFELWIYSISQQSFVYYNQWNQLILNVT